MDRKEDGLKALGAKTQYRMDYAPEVLETFVNKHPGNVGDFLGYAWFLCDDCLHCLLFL